MKMRNEVNEQLTWNVADIYETPTDFQKELKTIQKTADRFVKKYKGKLADIETVLLSLKDYEDILVMDSWLDHYAFLKEAEDYTKKESRELAHQAGNVLSAVHSQLAFFCYSSIFKHQTKQERCCCKLDRISIFRRSIHSS